MAENQHSYQFATYRGTGPEQLAFFVLQVHAGGFSVGVKIFVPKQWEQQKNLVTDALNNFNLAESGEHGYINLAPGPFSIQSCILTTTWPHRITEKMPIGDTKI